MQTVEKSKKVNTTYTTFYGRTVESENHVLELEKICFHSLTILERLHYTATPQSNKNINNIGSITHKIYCLTSHSIRTIHPSNFNAQNTPSTTSHIFQFPVSGNCFPDREYQSAEGVLVPVTLAAIHPGTNFHNYYIVQKTTSFVASSSNYEPISSHWRNGHLFLKPKSHGYLIIGAER